MIYLDCAATSFQKPGEVLRAYERTLLSASSPGRGLIRAGLHCAPLAHESAGTIATGTVRMSFSPFNTHGEVEAAAAKLIKII